MKATLKQSTRNILNHAGAIVAIAAVAWIGGAGALSAAIVEPDGYTTTFEVQPEASDWGSTSRPGASNEGYDMDEDVNAMISAALVTRFASASKLTNINASADISARIGSSARERLAPPLAHAPNAKAATASPTANLEFIESSSLKARP